jgi:hypothetical protein
MYDNIPSPLPGNLPSLGYQATSTAEFGGLIQFAAGTPRNVATVTTFMSDWALAADYPLLAESGWTHEITLNLYNVAVDSSGTPQPGSLINSFTQTFNIPWSGGCAGGYLAPDGNCYTGRGFEITFDLAAQEVPDQLIYGIAYNTETHGYAPIGASGPYNSLNVGLNTAGPTVGTNPLPDTAYWNTTFAGFYTDGGAGGTGTFRQDTNWTPYSGAVRFDAAPEPGTLVLMLGGGLMILTGSIRRKTQARR